jgi:hypothetical protein
MAGRVSVHLLLLYTFRTDVHLGGAQLTCRYCMKIKSSMQGVRNSSRDQTPFMQIVYGG